MHYTLELLKHIPQKSANVTTVHGGNPDAEGWQVATVIEGVGSRVRRVGRNHLFSAVRFFGSLALEDIRAGSFALAPSPLFPFLTHLLVLLHFLLLEY